MRRLAQGEQGGEVVHFQRIDDRTGITYGHLNQCQAWDIRMFTNELQIQGEASLGLRLGAQTMQWGGSAYIHRRFLLV